MPGLFGVVDLRRGARAGTGGLEALFDRLAAAVGAHADAPCQRWRDVDLGVAVGRSGPACVHDDRWPLEDGAGRLFLAGRPSLEGGAPRGFYAALRLSPDGAAMLCADRLGSRRIFYTVIDDRLCFAPEVRALARLPGVSRRIDPAAVGMLLSSGVMYRNQTLLADVRRLCGGERLVVAAGRWRLEETTRFEPGADVAGSVDLETLAEALEARLCDAARRHCADPDDAVLYLSGGVDSRLILAAMLANDPASARVAAVTWSDGPPEADSDAAVAARLAAALGLRHRLLLRRETGFAAKFERFNAAIGGASVVAAEHADEPELIAGLARHGHRRAFRGDQVFLIRPAAFTLEQAWQGVGLRRLRDSPAAALLSAAARADAIEATEATFRDIAERYGDYRPSQAKEMLYFDVRLQGYLLDAAHMRQKRLDERNVLLDDAVLDLLRETPDALRAKNALLRRCLERMTGGWPAVPLSRRRNLTAWTEQIGAGRPAGDHARALLLQPGGAVGDLFDEGAIGALAMAAGDGGRATHAIGRAAMNALRRASPRLGARFAAIGRRGYARPSELVKRTMVLIAAHRALLGD